MELITMELITVRPINFYPLELAIGFDFNRSVITGYHWLINQVETIITDCYQFVETTVTVIAIMATIKYYPVKQTEALTTAIDCYLVNWFEAIMQQFKFVEAKLTANPTSIDQLCHQLKQLLDQEQLINLIRVIIPFGASFIPFTKNYLKAESIITIATTDSYHLKELAII